MTRSLTRVQALFLGTAVLLGIALASAGLFLVGSRQWLWSDTFHVRVGFRQINGVEAGTRVRILGREAGEVEAVILPESPKGDVTLYLRLDGKLRKLVRKDAKAQIVDVGMVGGKVVEISPGSEAKEPVEDDATIASEASTDLTDVLTRVNDTLEKIRNSDGTLSKLIREDELYQQLVKAVKAGEKTFEQGEKTFADFRKKSDAFDELPVIGRYVTNVQKELYRPNCERNCKHFQEMELFEPGKATLTAQGRKSLDDLVPWLDGLKHKGSEVVIASYAHPSLDPDLARRLTLTQSEAVRDYLTTNHSIQKMGWFSWSRRVVPIGCGIESLPLPENKTLPLPRVEIVVFVPQN